MGTAAAGPHDPSTPDREPPPLTPPHTTKLLNLPPYDFRYGQLYFAAAEVGGGEGVRGRKCERSKGTGGEREARVRCERGGIYEDHCGGNALVPTGK